MEQIIDETRMDMAGVEGNLNFVISEVGSEWCNAEDVKRILTEQKSILETLRRELNQKMFFANKWSLYLTFVVKCVIIYPVSERKMKIVKFKTSCGTLFEGVEVNTNASYQGEDGFIQIVEAFVNGVFMTGEDIAAKSSVPLRELFQYIAK